MIKIVAWNIQQGGGSRVSQICSALIESKSQIIALNEFKNNSKGEAIRSKLLQAGYFHQLVGPVKADVNSICRRFQFGQTIY